MALILDGGSRSDAAKFAGVTLQIVRDWVLRFGVARGGALAACRFCPVGMGRICGVCYALYSEP